MDTHSFTTNRNFALFLKILNIAAALCFIAFGIIYLVTQTNLFFEILGFIFWTFQGLLLLVGEFGLSWLTVYFKFLSTFLGKGLYYAFLAWQIYFIDYTKLTGASNVFWWIGVISLNILTVVFILLHFITHGR